MQANNELITKQHNNNPEIKQDFEPQHTLYCKAYSSAAVVFY